MGRRLALAAVAALLLAGCGASSGGQETSEPARTATASAGAGPQIAGTDLDGTRVDVADFRGRPVFVNVWSSW